MKWAASLENRLLKLSEEEISSSFIHLIRTDSNVEPII